MAQQKDDGGKGLWARLLELLNLKQAKDDRPAQTHAVEPQASIPVRASTAPPSRVEPVSFDDLLPDFLERTGGDRKTNQPVKEPENVSFDHLASDFIRRTGGSELDLGVAVALSGSNPAAQPRLAPAELTPVLVEASPRVMDLEPLTFTHNGQPAIIDLSRYTQGAIEPSPLEYPEEIGVTQPGY